MSLKGTSSATNLLRGSINSLKTLTLSAYAIAVKNGFEGTEEEWLASLKGDAYILTEADKEEIAADVGGMVSEHPGRKDNPHEVTAEQVGARPDTWMPSAQDVGATPATHLEDKNNPHSVTAEQVGATPASHLADKDNPHGVTAEQVGARPNTWTPTASEVGARPNTWTPTASEVGARPSNWMPTAEDVLALNLDFITDNDHTIASGDDLKSYITPGSYRCSTGSVAATLKNSIPRTDSGFRLIVTAQSSTSGIVQIAIVNTRYTDVYVRTMTATDTWGDWVQLSHSGNSRPKLLWENKSPTSTFAGQSVSISGGAYDAYVLVAEASANTDDRIMLPMVIGYKGVGGFLQGFPNNKIGRRKFAINAAGTSVTFSDAEYGDTYGGNSKQNGYIVPMYIYGIYLS